MGRLFNEGTFLGYVIDVLDDDYTECYNYNNEYYPEVISSAQLLFTNWRYGN